MIEAQNIAEEINTLIEPIADNVDDGAYHCFSSSLETQWKEEGKIQQSSYGLVLQATAMFFRPENQQEPFSPMIVFSEGRTFLPQDLNEEQATFLLEVAEHVEHPEIKARLYDCLWVAKKPKGSIPQTAFKAIENYLAAVDKFPLRQLWIYPSSRLERALRLSLMINKKDFIEKAVKKVNEIISSPDPDSTFLTLHLVKLAIELKLHQNYNINLIDYVAVYEKSATLALTENDYNRAIEYWEAAADCYTVFKDSENSARCLKEVAETYVSKAEKLAASSGSFGASVSLSKAIEVYRRIGGYKQRIDEIHLSLNAHNRKALNEMQPSGFTIDLSEQVLKIRQYIEGQPKTEALRRYALLPIIPDFQQKKEIAQKHNTEFLHNLFDTQIYNRAGRVVAVKPGISLSGNTEQNEEALAYQTRWNIILEITANYVPACINAARMQIVSEHHIIKEDFFPLIRHNPFIPHGREMFFLDGLYKGFIGEMPEAIHLLLPQLENSLRHILTMKGGVPTRIENGVQQEKTLDTLLKEELIIESLGENITETLKTILTTKDGPNLRHSMAHGLINYEECYSYASIYFCWMMFHLCYGCHLMTLQNNNEKFPIK